MNRHALRRALLEALSEALREDELSLDQCRRWQNRALGITDEIQRAAHVALTSVDPKRGAV